MGGFLEKMRFLLLLRSFSRESGEGIRCVLKRSGKDFSNGLLME